MIKLTIVEDDDVIRRYIENEVEKYFFKYTFDYSIESFKSGVELIHIIKEKSFDIALLDIELPDMNGIDIANTLASNGCNTAVIFITSHEELMMKAFGFNVFAFIKKDNIKTELSATIHNLLGIINNLQVICVKTETGIVKIPLKNIISITLEERKVYVYLINKVKLRIIATTLSEITKQIQDPLFMKINRSTVVNIRYIESTKNTVVTILNRKDLKFIVSDLKKSSLDKCFMNYLLDNAYGNND